MEWLHYAAYFFGGAFLTNAIPHFVSGVMADLFKVPLPGRRARDFLLRRSTCFGDF